jgi:CRP-like cAMP-binding protein
MVFQPVQGTISAPVRRGGGAILGYHLAHVRLFRGLDEAEIEDIARDCTLLTVPRGAEVDLGAEPTHSVAFVVSGTLVATIHTEASRSIQVRSAGGEVFGIQPMFAPPTVATVLTAADPCTVILMRRAALLALIARRPELGLRLLEVASAQYHAAVEQLAEFGTLPVRERLIGELLRRCQPTSGGGGEIATPITHSALAQAIGTNRETVSRELSRLQASGLVARVRRGLHVRDLSALARLAAVVRRPAAGRAG